MPGKLFKILPPIKMSRYRANSMFVFPTYFVMKSLTSQPTVGGISVIAVKCNRAPRLGHTKNAIMGVFTIYFIQHP